VTHTIASGPFARFFFALVLTSLVACASRPTGEPGLRPGPQRLPHLQAQGDRVIASLDGATVTVQPMTPRALDAYFSQRVGANPFTAGPKVTDSPMAFVVRIQNRGRDRINFDPSQTFLIDQQNHRTAAMPYDELYSIFSESKERGRAMQVLDEAVLTAFLVVPPQIDRAGLLLFPPPVPEAKTLILDMGSFYIGSTSQLLLFEFEVHRAGP
jgi:hypothetical protein